MEIRIPRIERSKPTQTTLAKDERSALLQMAQGGGYPVLLRIMEMACILQDNKLISVEAADEKQIIAEQHIAVAKWEFFDFIQKQVQNEIHEFVNGPLVDVRTDQEREEFETLNP